MSTRPLRRFNFISIWHWTWRGGAWLLASHSMFASILLAESRSVAADDTNYTACNPINVLEEKLKTASPEVKEYFSKPLDQGPVGWCYAYTAAQALTLKLNKPVSAIQLSQLFNQAFNERDPLNIYKRPRTDLSEGGRIDLALMVGSDSLLCFDSALESNVTDDETYKKAWQNIADLHEADAAVASRRIPFRPAPTWRDKLMELREKIGFKSEPTCNDVSDSTRKVLKNLSAQEIIDTIHKQRYESYNQAVQKLVEKNCKGRMTRGPRVGIRRFFQEKQDPESLYRTSEAIDRNLDSGRLAMIGFSADPLANKDAFDKHLKLLGADENHRNRLSGGHAAVVIGRQKVGSKCYFTVRNSWGKNGCGNLIHHPDIICNQDGTFSIPHDLLPIVTLDVISLEDSTFHRSIRRPPPRRDSK